MGTVACCREIATPKSAENLEIPVSFGIKLKGFFKTWLVDRDPELDSREWGPGAQYQCHLFARSMRGRGMETAVNAWAEVGQAARHGVQVDDIETPLPFGTHALIWDTEREEPLHSSIAIGIGLDEEKLTQDATDHIQVFGPGGNIGIAPLRESVAYYGQGRSATVLILK
jgi:hypothetical protein